MKKIGMYLLAGAAAVILSACGSSQEEAAASSGVVDTQADKGLEVMGDQVVYDPNHLVNDGQPVSLDWWIWTSEDTFTAIAEEYEKIHPNVSIRVVYNPWDGYFTKLPLSLQKKEDGPALFNIHNSYDSLLAHYLEPYAIDTEDMIADYPSAASHVRDGKILLCRLWAFHRYGVLQ